MALSPNLKVAAIGKGVFGSSSGGLRLWSITSFCFCAGSLRGIFVRDTVVVVKALDSCFNVNCLIILSLLLREKWEAMDSLEKEVFKERMYVLIDFAFF